MGQERVFVIFRSNFLRYFRLGVSCTAEKFFCDVACRIFSEMGVTVSAQRLSTPNLTFKKLFRDEGTVLTY